MASDIDSFMRQNGYRYYSPKGHGTLRRITGDYDVWVKIDLKQKVAGVQIDHKWKWFNAGKLYGFVTTVKSDKYNVVRLLKQERSDDRTFNEVADMPLGGNREILG